jgi:hypothetical protein
LIDAGIKINCDKENFPEETFTQLESCVTILGQVGDEIAHILWDMMKVMGDTTYLLDRRYHIMVKNIEERNNLNLDNILYENKIYKREPGLKVLVSDLEKVFKLSGGINNENWEEVL